MAARDIPAQETGRAAYQKSTPSTSSNELEEAKEKVMNEDRIRSEEKYASEIEIERGGKPFGSCAAKSRCTL